ncbi:MAG: hypothetical protein SNF33_01030 [Candidatus Algichlamydia australiensis]|nr:hypothetical protein [Chlamydiales bacterium]
MKKLGTSFFIFFSLFGSIDLGKTPQRAKFVQQEVFTVSLKERYRLNNRTFHVVLEAPEISYTPGSVIAIYPESSSETFRPRHRYYSIASSLKATPGEIHLTVVTFTKEKDGHKTPGLCSNFLCKEAKIGQKINCFIPSKKKFSPPKSPDSPVIMISSGAGIAPFRGFMQERSQTPSKNWLIHGGRTYKDDFYYQEEWERLIASDHLKVTTAFSRDQDEKIYVQHRMHEHAEEIRKWIDEGAVVYICGNSKQMVKDVTKTLEEILGSKEQVDSLRKAGRLFP